MNSGLYPEPRNAPSYSAPGESPPLGQSPATSDDLTGQLIADRYRVLRKLGQGGMGRVYLAEHVRMGRYCAIKMMRPALLADTDATARFEREASNVSRITHPGVAAVYDFGEAADGVVYLAMEYVDGEPLAAVLQREESIPVDRALRIALQIADALGAAHEMGIVHRDLKPDNVMMVRNRDGTDCVKVVDFGLSKGLDSGAQKLTVTGLVLGTPAYMSPEQLAGDPVDVRSDLYSLGLVLFHMVTGALPFPAGNSGLLARLIAAPRTLAESKPEREWPTALQSLLDRALAAAPSDRYATARAMARHMTLILEGSPDSVTPSTGGGVPSGEVPGRSTALTVALIAVGVAAAILTVVMKG